MTLVVIKTIFGSNGSSSGSIHFYLTVSDPIPDLGNWNISDSVRFSDPKTLEPQVSSFDAMLDEKLFYLFQKCSYSIYQLVELNSMFF
jgi:hypothetical protein